MREFLGNVDLYFDPLLIEHLAEKIKIILENKDLAFALGSSKPYTIIKMP